MRDFDALPAPRAVPVPIYQTFHTQRCGPPRDQAMTHCMGSEPSRGEAWATLIMVGAARNHLKSLTPRRRGERGDDSAMIAPGFSARGSQSAPTFFLFPF